MNEKQIKHFFREYELNVWSRNKPFLYFTFITEAIYGWCSRQHWRIPSTILHTKNVEKKCVKYRCCHSHSPTQKLKILLGLLWIFYSCILSTQIKKYMFYFTHKLNRLSIKISNIFKLSTWADLLWLITVLLLYSGATSSKSFQHQT